MLCEKISGEHLSAIYCGRRNAHLLISSRQHGGTRFYEQYITGGTRLSAIGVLKLNDSCRPLWLLQRGSRLPLRSHRQRRESMEEGREGEISHNPSAFMSNDFPRHLDNVCNVFSYITEQSLATILQQVDQAMCLIADLIWLLYFTSLISVCRGWSYFSAAIRVQWLDEMCGFPFVVIS